MMNAHPQKERKKEIKKETNRERERCVRAVGLLGLPLGYPGEQLGGCRAVWLVGMLGPWPVGWLPLWLAGRLAG